MVFDWVNGRQLKSVTKDNVATTYTYNSDGMRIQKVASDGTTKYYYDGNNNLIASWFNNNTPSITTDDVTLYFFYDSDGSPLAFQYNKGERYYYVKNLQGDVEKIVDSAGDVYVTYAYDAWGNILSQTDNSDRNLATRNPFRYRGYVYDSETGLYYLQSRYYDPQTGRFLNADVYCDTGTGSPLSTNMYSYCENDPLNYIDSDGCIKVSLKEKKNNKLVITIRFYNQDIKNIKSGARWTIGVAEAVTLILGYKEVISTVAAIVVEVVLIAVSTAIEDYFDRNDYGKGAKIKIYVKYGFISFYYLSLKKNKFGFRSLETKKGKIPYAYLYKLPKVSWVK